MAEQLHVVCSMGDFLRDARYSIRKLAGSPGFTVVAVATLALGIGANTAIFSVVNGVLFKPLPYHQPERLVRVFTEWPNQTNFPVSPADFLDYRERNRAFSQIEVYMRRDRDLTVNGVPRRLKAMRITAGFFDLLGFHPELGRAFRPEEETNSTNNVVILSHHIWQEVFHGDPGVIGRGVRLSETEYTIVGVVPEGIQHVGGSYHSLPFGSEVDVWTPLPLYPDGPKQRGAHFLNAIARLKPDLTLDQAGADMSRIAAQLAHEYPDENRDGTIRLVPLKQEIVGAARPLILALWAAVCLVLLIACVNVANLLSARASARRREMAVRSALGAGRVRLVRQMLTESLVLAAAGGALGTVLAIWGVDALVALAPQNLPRLGTVKIDLAVLFTTMGTTFLTGLIFGLVPAFEGLRVNPNEALKDGDRGTTSGAGRARLRSILVTAEISLALMLLVGAGLLLRTFVALEQVPPGFQPEHVLTLNIFPPPAKYQDDKAVAFYQRLHERLSRLPGVTSVGFASDAPWTGYDENSSYEIPEHPTTIADRPSARYHFASPGYFETIGVPLQAGRYFQAGDKLKSPPVVVINAAMARRDFPSENAIGKKLDMWGTKGVTIIGVAGDVKDTPAAAGAIPAFYWCDWQQTDAAERVIVVRSRQEPTVIAKAVQEEVRQLDPNVPVTDLRTLDDIASAAVSAPRYALLLASIFAASALLLAAVGIYGVMSFSVTQRLHEIGIRMALGAQRRHVVGMMMSQGARLIVAGVLGGVGGALLMGRAMSVLLYGVRPNDPLTLTAFPLFLAVVAAGSCYLPARRATRVDPLVALRHE
jgi:predicted permease